MSYWFQVKDSGGRRSKFKLDTGAVEWVLTPSAGQYFDLVDDQVSENNIPLYAANGTGIKNFDQRELKRYSNEWAPLPATIQVAEVKTNLGTGMPMLEADNRMVLDKTGSYIENKKSRSRTKVNHEGGSFTFDFWVPARNGQNPRRGCVSEKGTKVIEEKSHQLTANTVT